MNEWILSLICAFAIAFAIALMLFGTVLSIVDQVMDVMKKRTRGAYKKEDE